MTDTREIHQADLHSQLECQIETSDRLRAENDAVKHAARALGQLFRESQSDAAAMRAALEKVTRLLDSHQHAWEHEEGCDGTDDVEDCRACEYGALLNATQAALQSSPGAKWLEVMRKAREALSHHRTQSLTGEVSRLRDEALAVIDELGDFK